MKDENKWFNKLARYWNSWSLNMNSLQKTNICFYFWAYG